ncbi:porin family protein [Methyloprofundus sp.]|uniref:porin family protein n=1 Tax=Methyloprofundus sp. TaxID=2020875 RepID=UPI003D0C87E6
MFKNTKIALSAATALLALTGLAVAPQASADDMAQLQARIANLEKQESERQTMGGGNMVSFRGGYARNNNPRQGDILTDTAGIAGQVNGEQDGWYVGAGLDLVLSDDLFGFEDSIEVLGEIMFEYKEFDQAFLAVGPLPTLLNNVAPGAVPAGTTVKVNQFTLTASPKVKFMKGSKFRPWIIPVGLAIHVISPPSDGVTVLEPGMHFAAGADYNVWKNIFVGADVRYNLTFGDLDGVDLNGFTTGAYVGFGF